MRASSKQPQDKRLIAAAGCSIALGAGALLLGFMGWNMVWGFAGQERHFIFGINLAATGSSAEITICPLEQIAVHMAVYFLVGGTFIGLGFLLSTKNFALSRLLMTTSIVAAVAFYPFISLQVFPPGTIAMVEMHFTPPLTAPQIANISRRLAPAAVAAWKPNPIDQTRAPTEAELDAAHYKLSIDGDLRVQFEFSGSSFARRNEIRAFYLKFLQAQVAEFSKDAGCPPIRPQDWHVQERLLEK